MKLAQLVEQAHIDGASILGGAANVELTHIAENSRQARPGTLFVAVHGSVHDGHKFIPGALELGAVAVAGVRTERPEGLPDSVPYLHVPDDRAAVAELSAAFFGHPSRKLQVIGVTGTDGKTTTSTLIHSILLAAGKRAGLISTIRAEIGGQSYDTGFHVTTPEAFDVQRYLHDMVEAGTDVAVLETTSHALDQGRVLCVDYDVAVVTNVTHEHMDWHGNWENYMEAKARALHGAQQELPQAIHAQSRRDQCRRQIIRLAQAHTRRHALRLRPDRRQQPDITADDLEFRPKARVS